MWLRAMVTGYVRLPDLTRKLFNHEHAEAYRGSCEGLVIQPLLSGFETAYVSGTCASSRFSTVPSHAGLSSDIYPQKPVPDDRLRVNVFSIYTTTRACS